MSLADTELSIGGVKLKGIYIAVVFSLATTIGSFIWAASSLYGRLEAVEAVQVPDVTPLHESIQLIEQQLKDNDISQLSAKLATLGTNLITISSQQERLLEITTSVSKLEKDIETMRAIVAKAELVVEDVNQIKANWDTAKTEYDDIWRALDALAMPL
jgi:small-conductance mechanosensitive channel